LFCWPTKSDGGKFGKTEERAFWLTEARTSPYAYYQFWLNTPDADVDRFLRTFTLLSREEIENISARHVANPGAREAQQALAKYATELLHGTKGLARAEAATQALFSGEVASLDRDALQQAFENAPATDHERSALVSGVPLIDLLPNTTLVKSKREAREFLSNGAVSVNGEKASVERNITTADLLHGEVILLRRGKNSWHDTRWK
jgi:tyrosyl-tRNA synthetase